MIPVVLDLRLPAALHHHRHRHDGLQMSGGDDRSQPARHLQVLRHGRGASTTSTSRCRTASSSSSSARRAAASRRCCASSPGWRSRARGEIRLDGKLRQRRAGGRPRARHGVPVLRALPAHERAREPRLRPGEHAHAARRDRRARRARRRACCAIEELLAAQAAASSPAASASASPSAAPSCAGRASSCSTSRCPTSTPSCASRCAPSSPRSASGIGGTMIYVTHDQVEAMTLADRIVVLNAGRIEQIGTPLELYNDPANRFVAGFIGSPRMNFLEAEARSRGGEGIGYGSPAATQFASNSARRQPAAGDRSSVGFRPQQAVLAAEGLPLARDAGRAARLGDDPALPHRRGGAGRDRAIRPGADRGRRDAASRRRTEPPCCSRGWRQDQDDPAGRRERSRIDLRSRISAAAAAVSLARPGTRRSPRASACFRARRCASP